MRRPDRRTRGPARLAAALVVGVLAVSGCGQKQGLRPHMLDAEYEAVLAEEFRLGMRSGEVESRLDALGISADCRRWYTSSAEYAGKGPQLLARVFEPGGRWLDQDDQTIGWVDTWFVFDAGEGLSAGDRRLVSWYIKRGNQRYFQGEPINTPPAGELEGPMRRWPFPPSWPARPPEGN